MTVLGIFTLATLTALGIIWLLHKTLPEVERRACPGCEWCDERRGK